MTTATASERSPLNWVTIPVLATINFCALTIVPWYGFTRGFSAAAWAWFAFFFIANGLSITAGYHRLWSHRAYNAHWSVRLFLMIFGTMALQNSILVWSSNHRVHHINVDDNDLDPYSAKRGFWFSHIGWMLRNYPSSQTDLSNVKDLKSDPLVMFQHRYYLPLVLAINFGFTFLAGWLAGDFWGVFWLAGMLRLVLSHHVTWFINSLAHAWGSQPYTDQNTARDNGVLAFFTFGEGYHNFHHIFASDYRNGVRWWQWDPTKWLIAGLSHVGLTTSLRRMPDVVIQQARMAMQFQRLEQLLASPRVSGRIDLEKIRAQITAETEAFRATLAEWAKVRDDWYADKKQKYADKKKELTQRWEHEQAKFRHQTRALLEQLRTQHRRLQLLNAQFAS